MKYIKYIKFAVSVLFFQLLLGNLCYQYGYANGEHFSGVGGMYCIVLYALIYLGICVGQCRKQFSKGRSIFSTVFVGVPYIALIIFACLPSTQVEALAFVVVLFITWGIALVLETVNLILGIKQDRLA